MRERVLVRNSAECGNIERRWKSRMRSERVQVLDVPRVCDDRRSLPLAVLSRGDTKRASKERRVANSETDNGGTAKKTRWRRTIAEKERRSAIPVARALTRSPASESISPKRTGERERGRGMTENREIARDREITRNVSVVTWVRRFASDFSREFHALRRSK